ncbi:hypothetical protein PHAVU_004G118200 [Phaseolus vulgaris]|uniref:RING-type E3 ubiquitin transferase n=1 Tax=Phaseolus vulgaris TaxID=3885 RepID=V7C4T8_PHAVU|nr:hypothetical protein PHAVU_004G118200g [Phaseolus vulgaris]ESW24295.1 hypothetical protein PHAVU_004G118200g [Phaseolus vulgaris]
MNTIVLLFLLASSLSAVSCTSRALSPSPATPYGPSNDDTVQATLLMSIIIFVSGLVVTALCSISIRYVSLQNTLPQPTIGLDPRVLAACPVMSYSALKLNHPKGQKTTAMQCAVCLADFADADALRLLLKCGHVFHTRCIDAWLAAHVTCPVCRGDVSAESKGDTRARHVLEEEDSVRGFGVLVRSHSTGHSLEGFSIKCPEEVKKKVLEDGECGNSTTMNRSASYDVVLGIGERGVGSTNNNNNNNNNNRWVLLTSVMREEREFEGITRTFFGCEV